MLLLNAAGAAEADKHVPLYLKKGLLREFENVARVASWMKRELKAGEVKNPAARKHRGPRTVEAALRDTLLRYDDAAASGAPDPLTNKTFFNNAPFDPEFAGPFYAGRVTPVVHYTMGGVRVDERGRVRRNNRRAAKTGEDVIPGLFAAGELIGGVHGKNRLGGNALTECAVFGRIVGAEVPLPGDEPPVETEQRKDLDEPKTTTAETEAETETEVETEAEAGSEAGSDDVDVDPHAPPTVTKAELAKHASEDSCWVALYGEVYDFTDFLEDHPAGAEAILKVGGRDGTEIFDAVHSPSMLEDFEALGALVD